eukprot:scaffold412_cov388-Prasinococcus_capsulatus_cf.AAC.28
MYNVFVRSDCITSCIYAACSHAGSVFKALQQYWRTTSYPWSPHATERVVEPQGGQEHALQGM